MTPPPWYAGQTVTASDLNQLVPQTAVLAANTPSSGTSPQVILTLSNLTPGTWQILGRVSYQAGASAGTVKLTFAASGGLAVSSMWVNTKYYAVNLGVQSVIPLALTNLAGTAESATMTDGDYYTVDFDGIITVSAAGALTVNVAEGTSGDTFTVQALSYARIEPVVS
jgi:hypothetical protein